jgi:hypothetical protein
VQLEAQATHFPAHIIIISKTEDALQVQIQTEHSLMTSIWNWILNTVLKFCLIKGDQCTDKLILCISREEQDLEQGKRNKYLWN